MKSTLSLLLLAGCGTTAGSTLSALDELTLSATTGGEESAVSSDAMMSPSEVPDSERPDPFRACDASGTYTGLFEQYDADGDGRLDAPESDDVMAARDGRSGDQERMVMAQWALLVTVYDLDGDGALGESERATLLSDFTARCSAIQAFLLATYDADGDGTLSAEEQDTARAALDAEMASHAPPDGGPPEGERSDGGPPDGDCPEGGPPTDASGAPPIPPPLMDEFDADGDGQLSDTELTTLRDTMRARIQGGEPLGPV
jgi:hypothetical protein